MTQKVSYRALWVSMFAVVITTAVFIITTGYEQSYAAVPHIYNMPAYDYAVAVTPHDTNTLSGTPLAIYVGGTGDLTVDFDNATDVVFKSVPTGLLLGVSPLRVKSTGTTATYIVALY